MPPKIDYSNGRVCRQCGVKKPQDAFYWKECKGRLSSRCRECKSKNYKENPVRARERSRDYYVANRDRVLARDKSFRSKNISRVLLNAARRRAKKMGIPFDLAVEDIPIPKRCPVLGFPLVVNEGRSRHNSPTLDRIIPTLGYTRGNVVVVSHRANTIKSDASIHELELVARFYADLLMRLKTT